VLIAVIVEQTNNKNAIEQMSVVFVFCHDVHLARLFA